MYILQRRGFLDDANIFITEFEALSESVDTLKELASEHKDVYDQAWQTKTDRKGIQYFELELNNYYDESFIITKEKVL